MTGLKKCKKLDKKLLDIPVRRTAEGLRRGQRAPPAALGGPACGAWCGACGAGAAGAGARGCAGVGAGGGAPKC